MDGASKNRELERGVFILPSRIELVLNDRRLTSHPAKLERDKANKDITSRDLCEKSEQVGRTDRFYR